MSAFVRVGNLTYEVSDLSLPELFRQLQAWADANDKAITAAITILPAAAQQASDLIAGALGGFVQ